MGLLHDFEKKKKRKKKSTMMKKYSFSIEVFITNLVIYSC